MAKWKDIPVCTALDLSLLQGTEPHRGKYKIAYEGSILAGYRVVTNLPWKRVEEWFEKAKVSLYKPAIATSWDRPRG